MHLHSSPDVILNPYRFASAGNGLLAGLAHFLNLDEASGNAVDAAGGATFTDTNTVTYSASSAPDGGNARSFDRANQERFVASAGAVMNWTAGEACSVAAWFKSGYVANNRFFWALANVVGSRNECVLTSAGNMIYTWGGGTGSFVSNYADDAWHSVVWTSTGSSGTPVSKMYLDGALLHTGARGFAVGNSAFNVGASYNAATGTMFHGLMCSMGIWRDRVLAPGDVTAWHNSGVNLRYAGLT